MGPVPRLGVQHFFQTLDDHVARRGPCIFHTGKGQICVLVRVGGDCLIAGLICKAWSFARGDWANMQPYDHPDYLLVMEGIFDLIDSGRYKGGIFEQIQSFDQPVPPEIMKLEKTSQRTYLGIFLERLEKRNYAWLVVPLQNSIWFKSTKNRCSVNFRSNALRCKMCLLTLQTLVVLVAHSLLFVILCIVFSYTYCLFMSLSLGLGVKIHIYASILRLYIIWLSPELGGRKGIRAIDDMIREVVDYRQDEAQGGPVDTVRAAHSCSMRQAPQDCWRPKCAPRLSLCIADFSKATRSPGQKSS